MPLAGVQAGGVGGAVLSLEAARQPLGALAPLEDLQAVGAFPPVPGTHLPFPQHRLADLGPEVPGAAQPGRAVRRAQAEVPFLTCAGTAGTRALSPGCSHQGCGVGGHPPTGGSGDGGGILD